MDRFKEEVKLAARGHWKSILISLCGLTHRQLNGAEQSCPKCNGNTRFRFIDEPNGALFCSHCFCNKNGDGLAAVMWMTGCNLPSATQKVADFLGIKPVKKSKTTSKNDPAGKLAFCDWNDLLAAGWCLKKKPITVDALKKLNAKMAVYRGQFKVIAIPVWSKKPDNVVGWTIYNITGGTLPKFIPKSSGKFDVEQVKVKLTFGSSAGLIGFLDIDSSIAYKTEGPTDLLALTSLNPSGSLLCNANGSKENPARSFDWLPEILDGKEIRVIHDCDQPGQEGATMVGDRPGWSTWLASKCENSTVKNVVLPYEIQPTHGKDLRDWINDGNTIEDLEELLNVDPVKSIKMGLPEIWEADDDPHRLARVNIDQYSRDHGGRLIFWQDEWWKYKKGRYQKIEIGELRAKVGGVIRKEFERIWRETKDPEGPVKKVTVGLVTNVISAMATMVNVASSVQMPCWLPTRKRKNYVSVKNGIIDLDAVFSGKSLDDCLMPHTSDWFTSVCLKYEWNPEAECPKWKKYLDDVMESDDDRIALLQEWAGYLLTPQNDQQKFLVLEGEGKNGKSAFFAAMTAMLGEDNVSHVPMENFGGRFDLGSTLGKAANISGDVGEIDQMAEGILKQFTGGDTMQFDRKCIQPIQAKPTAKLLCAWNSRPRIKDRSDGLWRRMDLVPFRSSIPENKRIFGMEQSEYWTDEAPGILLWAIAGLHRLRQNKKFTECDVSENAKADYQLDSNPAAEFFDDYIEENPRSSIDSKRLYEMYSHWCKESNCRPLGNRQFGKELRRNFPAVERTRIRNGNKLCWHYEKISFTVGEIFSEPVEVKDLF